MRATWRRELKRVWPNQYILCESPTRYISRRRVETNIKSAP
jgi:hypothetical protein